jgi:hypothetical protein
VKMVLTLRFAWISIRKTLNCHARFRINAGARSEKRVLQAHFLSGEHIFDEPLCEIYAQLIL